MSAPSAKQPVVEAAKATAVAPKQMPGYGWKHMPMASAISYSVISIAITLINKVVLSTYSFKSTMTLTLLQGLVTVLSLEGMRRAGWVEYQPASWDIMKKVAPLSFVFIGYVVVSLISLGRVNVPMFTALRRLTILFVMAEEWFLLDISPSAMVSYTVLMQFAGAALAGWYDLTFDPVSYFYLFLTNLFTSLYTVYISVVRKKTGLNLFAMMYYNNVTTMPFLLLLAWYTGDLGAALAFPHYGNLAFQVNFLLSIFLAFLLNLSTFYCTSLNTARTQTVVGQLKNFAAFLLGLLLFDDYIYEPFNFLGLWIGFAGSVWYAFVTADEKAEAPGGGALAKGGEAAGAGGGGAAPRGSGAAAITPSKLPGVLDTIKEEEDVEAFGAAATASDDVRKRQR